MKDNKFVFALFLVMLLAWIFPGPGAPDSIIPLKTIGSIGISLIFFFYGLKLSPEKLRAGLGNFRLHLLVQLSTFLLFPLIVMVFYPLMKTESQQTLWLAMFFLAALPSTVSSSVVLTSLGKGNVPAAIFNASISGIIGIMVTPLWMGLFMHAKSGDFDFSQIYLKLFLEIILPVILGLLLRPKFHHFTNRFSPQLTLFDKSVILLIVYRSFAASFHAGYFEGISWPDLFLLMAIVIGLFFLIYGIIFLLTRAFGFNREDRITALFCGSQKSLVHGSVFSNVLFAGMSIGGIMLLPLMIFHAFQIFVISVISSRYARREGV
jgi:solute carrier family 10 (sodium/bile acid cotransporter), member 7